MTLLTCGFGYNEAKNRTAPSGAVNSYPGPRRPLGGRL